MTNHNPYLDPDADDDLFITDASESATADESLGIGGRRHNLDGSKCTVCGKIHNIAVLPDVPEDVLDKLSEFLDQLPEDSKTQDIILSSGSSAGNKILADFVSFALDIDEINSDSPVFRALCETVDELVEQTGGQEGYLIKKINLYKTEHILVSTHTVLKSVNKLAENFKDREDLSEVQDKIQATFNVIVHTVMQRLKVITEKYRIAAAEAGVEVDRDLINTGKYTNPNRYATAMMEHPFIEAIKDHPDDANTSDD